MSAPSRLILGNPEQLGANLGAKPSAVPDEALRIKEAAASVYLSGDPSHRLSGGSYWGTEFGSH